jgi:hypothetical protein
MKTKSPSASQKTNPIKANLKPRTVPAESDPHFYQKNASTPVFHQKNKLFTARAQS